MLTILLMAGAATVDETDLETNLDLPFPLLPQLGQEMYNANCSSAHILPDSNCTEPCTSDISNSRVKKTRQAVHATEMWL
jgi:hypothetical protein